MISGRGGEEQGREAPRVGTGAILGQADPPHHCWTMVHGTIVLGMESAFSLQLQGLKIGQGGGWIPRGQGSGQ
jgi:hypothetical protein